MDRSVFVCVDHINTYNSVQLFPFSKDGLAVSLISLIDEWISVRSRPHLTLRTYQRR